MARDTTRTKVYSNSAIAAALLKCDIAYFERNQGYAHTYKAFPRGLLDKYRLSARVPSVELFLEDLSVEEREQVAGGIISERVFTEIGEDIRMITFFRKAVGEQKETEQPKELRRPWEDFSGLPDLG